MSTRLPVDARLGGVSLQVSDLERSVAWYRDVLGARVIGQSASPTASGDAATATLGAHDQPDVLLTLREHTGAEAMPSRGRLGLFHVAWLLPDRAALGRFVTHLAARGERAGSADHLVSEALYLQDPDGLGVEVYTDRPREQWRVVGDQVEMASLPLGVADLVRSAGGVAYIGMPAGTRIGHVHLHVGDLEASTRFYRDTIGFDVTQSGYPGARFLSAGGYHHHLGTNTWAGAQARSPAPGHAQLLYWEVLLPSDAAVQAVAERVAASGMGEADAGATALPDGIELRDPWGTALRVRRAP